MRFRSAARLAVAALALAGCQPTPPAAAPPAPGPDLAWAYARGAGVYLPDYPAGPQTVPGSARTYTDVELKGDTDPDWFPGEHPPAPDIVARHVTGRAAPCAECHQIEGQGFLTTPDIAGLPKAYILQQIEEFRSGRRRSQPADRVATASMIREAQAVSDADAATAAAYFASLTRRPLIRVVETDTAPAVRADKYGWWDLVPGGRPEPIGGRIVEVPADPMRAIREDPHSGSVVYVPKGSVARGAALVRTGGPAGLSCRSCHGPDLRGQAGTPSIAGRSPGYIARQLWDIRTGVRGGPAVAPMQATAKGLSQADIRDLAAYLATVSP